MRERIGYGLRLALYVGLAAVTMGTFVSVAGFAEYGPLVGLEVGSTLIGVSLLTGVLLGLQAKEDDPQRAILAAFLASLGAIVIVVVTILAPVLAGVLEDLGDLGSSGTARLAFLFTALFIVPIHVVGAVVGYALADYLAPRGVRRDLRES